MRIGKRQIMDEKVSNQKMIWFVTILIFIGNLALRFGTGNYEKCIGVYADELRYLHISRSLFESGRMLMRGGGYRLPKNIVPFADIPG